MDYCEIFFILLHTTTDWISDTVMARQGFARMGFSACFGGPFFSILEANLNIISCYFLSDSIVLMLYQIRHLLGSFIGRYQQVLWRRASYFQFSAPEQLQGTSLGVTLQEDCRCLK